MTLELSSELVWKELKDELFAVLGMVTAQELGRKAITNLVTDMRHPGLRVKKIQGTGGIWEARVSASLRITFEIRDDLIILRSIGPHDETLGRP